MVKKTSLSLSKIKHSYNNNDFILNDINLDVSEGEIVACLLYTSPSPRDATLSRMPSSA